jgi:hypothetical protein
MITTEDAEARARIRLFFPPATIALICVPFVFGLIPRNRWYGVRVRDAMAPTRNGMRRIGWRESC